MEEGEKKAETRRDSHSVFWLFNMKIKLKSEPGKSALWLKDACYFSRGLEFSFHHTQQWFMTACDPIPGVPGL